MKNKSTLIISLLFATVLQVHAGNATNETAPSPSLKDLMTDEAADKPELNQVVVAKSVPQDEFNRGTPRSSIAGLGESSRNRDYARMLNYLDMRNLPSALANDKPELVRQLKIIADRTLWVDVDTVSNDPKGYSDDGLPSYRDIIARLPMPDGTVDILMQRVPNGKGSDIWKLSNSTVAEIPRLYAHYGYGEYGDKLSKILPEYELLSLEIWQWAMLLAILLVAFVISWIITFVAIQLLRLRKSKSIVHLSAFFRGPVRFLILVLIFRANFDLISPGYLATAVFTAKTIEILAFAWLLMGLVKLSLGRLGDRMRENGKDQATVFLRPAMTLINVIIIAIGVISWLSHLGVNVSAMLAGLGVGGIAIGLAAQKSLENLIGGITLYVAQPVRIGDFCRVGKTLGVVEEIGLRATMLRTLDRTLVTIPNGTMASLDIENLTKRDKILYRRTIRLRNDASPEQIRSILNNVRAMFKTHADVDPEPARIRFIEYGEHSLNMEAFAYITTRDFNEFLVSVEDLNLRILDIVAAAGTQLALPARSIRLEGEAGSL